MRRKRINGTRGDVTRVDPSRADANDGMVALCEEWVALLRRRRATPSRIRRAAAGLRSLARDVRAGKRTTPSDYELREIAGVLASVSPRSGRESTSEDEAALARRGLLAWTESPGAEDWSAYYPTRLRKGRKTG